MDWHVDRSCRLESNRRRRSDEYARSPTLAITERPGNNGNANIVRSLGWDPVGRYQRNVARHFAQTKRDVSVSVAEAAGKAGSAITIPKQLLHVGRFELTEGRKVVARGQVVQSDAGKQPPRVGSDCALPECVQRGFAGLRCSRVRFEPGCKFGTVIPLAMRARKSSSPSSAAALSLYPFRWRNALPANRAIRLFPPTNDWFSASDCISAAALRKIVG